jgi:uncharacterized protein YjbI with pentapeptide repeats
MNLAMCRNSNFTDADLHAATLFRADLSGSTFVGANLWVTNLASANFSGADLTRADIREANLSGTTIDSHMYDVAIWDAS